jgi:predicted dehydrogenase
MDSNFTRREFLYSTGAAALTAAAAPSLLAQTSKKIGVAFVGVAHIHTPGYLSAVKKRDDVILKWVWDRDTDRARKRAAEVGAQVAADLTQIWSDPDVQAVIICSETNQHRELVLAAAQAHKNMFVEKPLGTTGKESIAMANAIERAGLLFTTGYGMRTDPKHLFLKHEVVKGNFGTITRARGSNCHNGSLERWFDTDWRWMADPKIAGVGAFGDLGTHKLDILMWLFGDIEAVTAAIRSVTGNYGDCDETGEGLLQFRSGIIGSLAAGWVDIEDPVQLLISGTEGHAIIVNGRLYYKSKRVPGSDSKEPWTKLPAALPSPLQQFLDAVGGAKGQPLVTPREAAARVVAMEAMYKGSQDRKWVKLG